MAYEDEIQIFVGTDRSQRIGLRVLEYSIGQHTQRPFRIHSLEGLALPEPNDKRQVQRTGFSFARFKIPELMAYRDKAIYMDADMQVFADIGELWDIPFQKQKMLIQQAVPTQGRFSNELIGRRKTRAKQSSVSLLNCAQLNWDIDQIVAGLDGEYDYHQLMSELCILDDADLGYRIPPKWNSLEYWDKNTCNLHYTDMHTQPWVSPLNVNGHRWVNCLRQMLEQGVLTLSDVQKEIDLGYARPSLKLQLEQAPESPSTAEDYLVFDNARGFEMHKQVMQAKKARLQAEKQWMEDNGIKPALSERVRAPRQLIQGVRKKIKNRSFKELSTVPRVEHQGVFDNRRPLRILLVANSNLPTLQIAFSRPLGRLAQKGVVEYRLLTENEIAGQGQSRLRLKKSGEALIEETFLELRPDLVVFCRYSGPESEALIRLAKSSGAKILTYMDDDLLNVPKELGIEKYNYHRDPLRIKALRNVLESADLIYSSTAELSQRLNAYGLSAPMCTAHIFCPGACIKEPARAGNKRFGYMGFGHEYDLALAIDGIVDVLQGDPETQFDLFGRIPKPEVLNQFGNRVRCIEPEWSYEGFIRRLATLDWAVGLCPLAELPFNKVKADTKWVEYTSVGTAVIGSDHTVYQQALSDNCGVLVAENQSWSEAIQTLLNDHQTRYEMVRTAQKRLRDEYSESKFDQQLLNVFDRLDLHVEPPVRTIQRPAMSIPSSV